jgi:radical SAM protein with 4Fe4S-binding SPASM domain
MDEALFQRIVAESKDIADEMVLHVLGEPLLHPQVLDFIDIVHKAGMTVMVTTNGTLLNSELAKKKIRQINISLHAMSELPGTEEYLDKVVYFAREAQQYNPEGYINLRLWNKSSRIQWKSKRLEGRIYLCLDKQFAWPDVGLPVRQTKGFCYGLQTHIGVLVDGTVIPCCLDSAGTIDLGNLKETTLQEILASERVQDMLAGFKQGFLVEPLCQRCEYRQRFKGQNI